MLVKEVMKTAIGVESDISLKKASDIMSEKDISSLIVVKDKEVVGIITEDDMVDHFGKKKKISEVMTKNVVTISPDETTDRAKSLMKEKTISILPVVDKKNGLVGVISDKELLHDASSNEDHFLMG